MKHLKENTTASRSSRRKLVLLFAMILIFGAPSVFAQNSRGDKPAASKPIRIFPKVKSNHKGGDHANTRDISGRRRIRTKNKSSASHVFYPARGPYVNNSSKKPAKTRIYTRTASGNRVVRRVPNNQQRAWTSNLRGGPVGSASASRSFITRGRKNVYWGKFRKGERPVTRDLTGRSVRTRNFHSSPIGTGRSDTMQVTLRKPSREGSRFGKIRGGYSSVSGRNGKGWSGDISGHGLRSPRSRSGKRGGFLFGGFRSASGKGNSNQPIPVRQPGIGASGLSRMLRKMRGRQAVGYGSGTANFRGNFRAGDLHPGYSGTAGGYRGGIARQDLSPPFGRAGAGFRGGIKQRRPLRGGGSISGRFFNNSGRPLAGRPPGSQGGGGFRGNFRREDLLPSMSRGGSGYSGGIKGRRPLKGGGSVSGKFMRTNGLPLAVRPPGQGGRAIGNFRGNVQREDLSPGITRGGGGYRGGIRARRPLKGGGSVSGKFMLHDGKPIAVNPPGPGSRGIGRFQGSIRGHRPLKGGGSVSGKFMLHDGKPLAVNPPGPGSRGIGKFQGSIRAHRPLKGGGSVSGKLWNNDEKPIEVKAPISYDVTGYIGDVKLSRFKKYYVKNPNSAELAMKKRKPKDPTYQISGLGVHAKRPPYVRNPNSNKLAPLKVKPSDNFYAIGGFGVKAKQRSYVHNPSSNDKALRTLAPGKAAAKIRDFQGNVRMVKLTNKRLHPDAKFAHGNKDNVKSERSLKTNIKLIWAKLFKKNAVQPAIVKAKTHESKFDKKEKDLWKALYD